jgi:hypothetical protein
MRATSLDGLLELNLLIFEFSGVATVARKKCNIFKHEVAQGLPQRLNEVRRRPEKARQEPRTPDPRFRWSK